MLCTLTSDLTRYVGIRPSKAVSESLRTLVDASVLAAQRHPLGEKRPLRELFKQAC